MNLSIILLLSKNLKKDKGSTYLAYVNETEVKVNIGKDGGNYYVTNFDYVVRESKERYADDDMIKDDTTNYSLVDLVEVYNNRNKMEIKNG